MTPPKKWPQNAEWARMDSIALAQDGCLLLDEYLDDVNDPELLRRMAKAIKAFKDIELKLKAVGPQKDKEKTHD